MNAFAQINEQLLKGAPLDFDDYILHNDKLEMDIREAVGGLIPFTAKVFQADKVNLNRRIYPREVMAAAIVAANRLCKEGKFTGAIDHSWDGLRDCCIVWDEFTMDDTGAGFGEGRIISGTKHGEHLAVLKKAGVKIGFSTSGRGSGHAPSEEERKRYGLGENADVCIINADYVMKKVDPVDGPACIDAYMKSKESASDPASSGKNPRKTESFTETTMKTIAEMQTANPELYGLHTKAIADAVAAAVEPKTAEITNLNKVTESLQSFIDGAAKLPGIKLPFKDVTAKEAADQIAAANAATAVKESEITALKTQLETANAKIKVLETEKATKDAEVANANRKSAVTLEAATLLKGHKYEAQLDAAVKNMVDDSSFTVDSLKKLVADKTTEWDAISANKVPDMDAFRIPKTDPAATNKSEKHDLSTAKGVKESFQL